MTAGCAPRWRKGRGDRKPGAAAISEIRSPEQRFAGRTGPLQLLIIGGSLGARVLNENVPRALALIAADKRPLVVHQCGAAHVDSVRALYQTLEVAAEVVDFIDDMPARYAVADVVICRAGAITVSELAAAGVASVLVPLIVSTTSHQRENAEYMAARDAAIHLPQAELTPQRACRAVARLDARSIAAHRSGRAVDRQTGCDRAGGRRQSSGWRLRPGRMKHAVKHIHFVGIGGSGMWGIAEVLLTLGYRVSGSDSAATRRRGDSRSSREGHAGSSR